MIKCLARLNQGGNLYVFGLTEANLNRMEFNQEPIFFDFGYADHPEQFALIHYFPQFAEPKDVEAETLIRFCSRLIDEKRGVTFETLRVFPIAQSVMQQFRSTPFWSLDARCPITSPNDKQLFFAGQDEQSIEKYLVDSGLISPKTKRTTKGFGRFER